MTNVIKQWKTNLNIKERKHAQSNYHFLSLGKNLINSKYIINFKVHHIQFLLILYNL